MDMPVLLAFVGLILIFFSGANPVIGGVGVILIGLGAFMSFGSRDD